MDILPPNHPCLKHHCALWYTLPQNEHEGISFPRRFGCCEFRVSLWCRYIASVWEIPDFAWKEGLTPKHVISGDLGAVPELIFLFSLFHKPDYSLLTPSGLTKYHSRFSVFGYQSPGPWCWPLQGPDSMRPLSRHFSEVLFFLCQNWICYKSSFLPIVEPQHICTNSRTGPQKNLTSQGALCI